MFLALILYIANSTRIIARVWRRARAEIIKVETDSDNCMMVTLSYLVEGPDSQAAAPRVATIQFKESYRSATFDKVPDRIQAHYDLQAVDVWYALEVPDECYLEKPNNVTRAIGAVVGVATAVSMAIGGSYFLLAAWFARVTN